MDTETLAAQEPEAPLANQTDACADTKEAPKKRSLGRILFCLFRRALLAILLVVGLVVAAAAIACSTIFNGPSDEAREKLFFCFDEPSGTKWIPGLFLSREEIEAIRNKPALPRPTPQVSGQVHINTSNSLNDDNDAWKNYPDGIRIEQVSGATYTGHVMLVRDPSRVYLAPSSRKYSFDIEDAKLNELMESEGAIAGINGGAFYDDGSGSALVGRIPIGLVVSQGEIIWDDGNSWYGFVGFNSSNVLVVAQTITADLAKQLNIRDGCCFGPVLIMDGQVNAEVYNTSSGLNPRTCIGQRADGTVILLCIDGRQANSLGGTYADCIDILVEYGAVNACNLDGGSSTAMFYRDSYGRYGEAGRLVMINSYSLLQSEPRGMPTFFMVRPGKEDGQ